MKPSRPTEIRRFQTTQEIRVALSPVTGCKYRQVQVFVAADEAVYAALDLDNVQISDAEKRAWYDTDPEERLTAGELTGLNRGYKLPMLSGGAQIKFMLENKQSLSLATKTGTALVTLIVEYF